MQYEVRLKATVEAPSAEAAKTLFNAEKGVISTVVDVTPDKQWAVTVSVPVIYVFDLTVNAESKDEAEGIAICEIESICSLEEFLQCDVVNDYEYDVDTFNCEVTSVEPLEDEGAESAAPGTATEISAA
jgi:hypothetical protein